MITFNEVDVISSNLSSSICGNMFKKKNDEFIPYLN
jgi:hypothetical protein